MSLELSTFKNSCYYCWKVQKLVLGIVLTKSRFHSDGHLKIPSYRKSPMTSSHDYVHGPKDTNHYSFVINGKGQKNLGKTKNFCPKKGGKFEENAL